MHGCRWTDSEETKTIYRPSPGIEHELISYSSVGSRTELNSKIGSSSHRDCTFMCVSPDRSRLQDFFPARIMHAGNTFGTALYDALTLLLVGLKTEIAL